jgi:spermidine synthase
MGFYIIPEFGISNPAIISGIGLMLLPAISLFKLKVRLAGLLLRLFTTLGAWKMNSKEQYPDNYNVIYQSDGILGQIKVVDHPSYGFTEDNRMGRGLIVNNTLQTYVGLEDERKYSIWSWAHYFPTAASIFPPKSKVLVLGLGGGTLVKQFTQLGFDIDAVEIDRRVKDISIKYFNMDPDINVVIDDARHYIRTCGKTYDIVVFDTFLSESVPEHLLTMEGFSNTREILNPEGMIMVNFYGFIEGKTGKAARSVLKTLQESDFITEVMATPGTEDTRNLIFIASDKEQDFDLINYEEPNFPRITDLYAHFLDQKSIDLSDVTALTDEKPKLSKLYAKASMRWKRSYNDYYSRYFFK